jgi:hypothetical protein
LGPVDESLSALVTYLRRVTRLPWHEDWDAGRTAMKCIISAVALLTLSLSCGACQSCAKGKTIKGYRGGGTITYIPRPGLFGSEGVQVDFSAFAFSAGVNEKVSLAGLPPMENPYSLELVVAEEDLSGAKSDFDGADTGAIRIKTSLAATDGKTIWDCDEALDRWIKTGVYGPNGARETKYYYGGNSTNDCGNAPGTGCSFVPERGTSYTLSLSLQYTGTDPRILRRKVRFRLQSGGFK